MIYNVDLPAADAKPELPAYHLNPEQAAAVTAYQAEQEGTWKPYAAAAVAAVAVAALFVWLDKKGKR